MVKKKNNTGKCLHDIIYSIGVQEGFRDVKSFELGNCMRCNTTLKINYDSYKLKKGYRLVRHDSFHTKTYPIYYNYTI